MDLNPRGDVMAHSELTKEVSERGENMKMNEIKMKAKTLGVKVMATTKKADLIRQIQKAERNFDCFGAAKDYCDQLDCCFREDCLPLIKLKRRRSS